MQRFVRSNARFMKLCVPPFSKVPMRTGLGVAITSSYMSTITAQSESINENLNFQTVTSKPLSEQDSELKHLQEIVNSPNVLRVYEYIEDIMRNGHAEKIYRLTADHPDVVIKLLDRLDKNVATIFLFNLVENRNKVKIDVLSKLFKNVLEKEGNENIAKILKKKGFSDDPKISFTSEVTESNGERQYSFGIKIIDKISNL